VLPGSDRDRAAIPLERIRGRLAETRFGEEEIRLTVSVGAAEYPADRPQNAEDLLRFADRAMYAAKRLGKNQVVFYRDLRGGDSGSGG
jgi:diguanylate cyclase (GGDEF)-like protein